MTQRHGGDGFEVIPLDLFMPLKRRQRAHRSHQRELGTQTIGAECLAQTRAQRQHLVVHHHGVKRLTRFHNPLLKTVIFSLLLRLVAFRVAVKCVTPLDHGDAQINILRCFNLHR